MLNRISIAILPAIAAVVLVGCSSSGGGSSGSDFFAGYSCTEDFFIEADNSGGGLAPVYDYADGPVHQLTVIKVSAANFIVNNPQACFPMDGSPPDERCGLAQVLISMPDLADPQTPQNSVLAPVFHGVAPSDPLSVLALIGEPELTSGERYQVSALKSLDDGNWSCGCVRFTGGQAGQEDNTGVNCG